jgi:hypothetical protein
MGIPSRSLQKGLPTFACVRITQEALGETHALAYIRTEIVFG